MVDPVLNPAAVAKVDPVTGKFDVSLIPVELVNLEASAADHAADAATYASQSASFAAAAAASAAQSGGDASAAASAAAALAAQAAAEAAQSAAVQAAADAEAAAAGGGVSQQQVNTAIAENVSAVGKITGGKVTDLLNAAGTGPYNPPDSADDVNAIPTQARSGANGVAALDVEKHALYTELAAGDLVTQTSLGDSTVANRRHARADAPVGWVMDRQPVAADTAANKIAPGDLIFLIGRAP